MFLTIGEDRISSETFFGRLYRDIGFNLITKYKFKPEMRRVVQNSLTKTEKIFQRTRKVSSTISKVPRFIYAHFQMPHYPYYLDKNGNYNNFNVILEENWSQQKEYLGYLQYCNKRFLELIDQILAKSKQPPLIVFMSDHGFREFASDEVNHEYYFMNINAIYLPSKNYQNFYDGMSNVNQFRVILNTEFGQRLPLLKDSSIFIK
jgi:arylsulfatase A-like enzyme